MGKGPRKDENRSGGERSAQGGEGADLSYERSVDDRRSDGRRVRDACSPLRDESAQHRISELTTHDPPITDLRLQHRLQPHRVLPPLQIAKGDTGRASGWASVRRASSAPRLSPRSTKPR